MNFLRRELAPISQAAWDQIDELAKQTLSTLLSARKIVDFDGPYGIARASVPRGRLSVPDKQNGDVRYGIHQVLPLVETRVMFTLPIWELDNADRGAKDLQLDSLIKACQEIAAFENNAIFNGFEPGNISGLLQADENVKVDIALTPESVIDAVSRAKAEMLEKGVSGPAHLAVSLPLWTYLAHNVPGGTLRGIVERQIGGDVILAPEAKDGVLISARGGDAELTVGQDFAIGFQSRTATEVELYLTESFTFHVNAPEAMVGLTLK